MARGAAPAVRTAALSVGLGLSALLLTIVVGAGLALGTRQISLATVLDALAAGDPSGTDQMVVHSLRLPRTVIGVVAGAALAVAGALMQGLTRNPLADPGLLGVNAGASLFVIAGISMFGVTAASGYIWFAFAGAAAGAVLVYVVASGVGSARAGPSPVSVTLAGAAVTAAVSSIITLVLSPRSTPWASTGSG